MKAPTQQFGLRVSAAWESTLDAEVVSFGVGKPHPALAIRPSVIFDEGRAQGEYALDLLVSGSWVRVGWYQVEMNAVLDPPGLGNLDEEQVHGTVGRTYQALGIFRVVGVAGILLEPGDL
jgi:hypothetical protein